MHGKPYIFLVLFSSASDVSIFHENKYWKLQAPRMCLRNAMASRTIKLRGKLSSYVMMLTMYRSWEVANSCVLMKIWDTYTMSNEIGQVQIIVE